MKAQGPPPAAGGHWVELTAPGAQPLPAERCRFRDPSPPYAEGNGYETTWQPDIGERRALLNGAPVILRVWGDAHPPVHVGVGDPPPGGVVWVDRGLFMQALGRTFSALADQDGELDCHGARVRAEDQQDITREQASDPDRYRQIQQHATATFEALALADTAPNGGKGDWVNADGFLRIFEHMLGATIAERAHAATQATDGPQPTQ